HARVPRTRALPVAARRVRPPAVPEVRGAATNRAASRRGVGKGGGRTVAAVPRFLPAARRDVVRGQPGRAAAHPPRAGSTCAEPDAGVTRAGRAGAAEAVPTSAPGACRAPAGPPGRARRRGVAPIRAAAPADAPTPAGPGVRPSGVVVGPNDPPARRFGSTVARPGAGP